MADAVARLTSGDKIGVFVMQHGPGSENAFGGVAQAFSESVPILVMPVGYVRRSANHFPNFNSALNFKNVTKSSEPLMMGKHVVEVMRRNISNMRNGRPGPVLVELPWDVVGEEIDELIHYKPVKKARFGPDPEDVATVAKELVASKDLVIYAGQGVHYAKAWDELQELAELLHAPVATTIEGKSAFPENHPLSLGTAGRSSPQQLADYITGADTLFGIGCSNLFNFYNRRVERKL